MRSLLVGDGIGGIEAFLDVATLRTSIQGDNSAVPSVPPFQMVFTVSMLPFTQGGGPRKLLMEPSILESIGSVEFIFDGSRHIVDGGGHGTRLRLLLEKYPHARETLFEKAKVLAMRPPVPSTIADRLEAVDGDFFKSVSAGADTYILQQVIHVWDDDSSLRILKSCKAAMGTDGKIVINDTVIPPGNEPNFNKLTDLHMMVLTHGGKERTETEFRDLVARAGLSLRRVVPTSTAFSLLEVGNRV